MSTHAETHAHEEHHEHPNYVKVWAILLVLLVVSVVGPMFGIRILTLMTAFGIAVVKAYLVAKNFMHLNIERRVVIYILVTMLSLMLVFFFGVSPDVMKHYGMNWQNRAAIDLPHHPTGAGHGGGHEAPAADHGAAPAEHGAAPADHGAAPADHGAAPAEGAAPAGEKAGGAH